MKNIERLLTSTPEQIGRFLCGLIVDCDDCPAFIFARCNCVGVIGNDENGFLKWLEEETDEDEENDVF